MKTILLITTTVILGLFWSQIEAAAFHHPVSAVDKHTDEYGLDNTNETSHKNRREITVNNDIAASSATCANGTSSSFPRFTSCSEIKRAIGNAESGYYNLVINGVTVRVYCNMDTLCNSDAGWTLLSKLDMTDRTISCPIGLDQYVQSGVRMCRRSPLSGPGCNSFNISSHNIHYSRVCGRVRGYQYAASDGFHQSSGINMPYVDGVSITYGSPRQHIWSFAAGYLEATTSVYGGCPCNTGAPTSSNPPSFVGSNYYCESGFTSAISYNFTTTDPLWDGESCLSKETPCCYPSLLPWFDSHLSTSTTDSIEVRLCTDNHVLHRNIGIDQYEFYVT